jgi:hypothetical protein
MKVKLMSEMRASAPIAQVVADMKSEAMLLERSGAKALADSKRFDAERIAAACPDAMTWLNESEACLRSGWTLNRVRRHAAQYETAGTARRLGKRGQWQLLAVIVPQRLATSLMVLAAEQAAAS